MVGASTFERAETRDHAERRAVMVRTLAYLVVLGVVAGFLWSYREGYYEGLPFPHNSFLFIPMAHFSDLTDFYAVVRANHPYDSFIAVYPPFGYMVMEPFAWLGGTAAVLLWLVLVVGGLGAFVARQLDFIPRIDRAAAVVILTVVTYPFLFSFDRGNIEAFVTLLLAAFVWALQTDRTDLAAVAIGAAAAMKGYPLIFAALFLARARWRPLAITAVTTFWLTLAGAITYHFDLSQYRGHLHYFNQANVIGDVGWGWGCSLWGALKILVVTVLGGSTQTVRDLLPIYTACTAVLALGVLLALWRLPLRFWEQITLLTVAFDVLPPAVGDYKLLHLVVPMVLFLRYGSRDRWRWWYLTAFAALMVPKAYVLLRPDGTSLGVVIDPLIMMMMGLAIIAAGLARGRTVAFGAISSSPHPPLS